MPTHKREKVASIHNHFNIFRNIHEAHEGPVTTEEQIVAIERFIRWHERQLLVGKALLVRLKAEAGQLVSTD